ncbi:hypothetical protein PDK32_27510 [Bacillus cereus]|nr:hypothetical protein [Bacillus cereus]
MIYEEFGLAKKLNQILVPHGIHINNSFEEFLKLKETPAAAVKELKDCLVKVYERLSRRFLCCRWV